MLTMIIDIFIIFVLNVFCTCLGNLKTTFLAQKEKKPVYITTFIDAVVFVYSFKLVTSSSGYGFVLSFALGKILGVFLANIIEKKLALGLLEIDVYKHPDQGKILADTLRDLGYFVTTTFGYGMKGSDRLILTVILPRKKFPDFRRIVDRDGNTNMSVKSITKTYGKVSSFKVMTDN